MLRVVGGEGPCEATPVRGRYFQLGEARGWLVQEGGQVERPRALPWRRQGRDDAVARLLRDHGGRSRGRLVAFAEGGVDERRHGNGIASQRHSEHRQVLVLADPGPQSEQVVGADGATSGGESRAVEARVAEDDVVDGVGRRAPGGEPGRAGHEPYADAAGAGGAEQRTCGSGNVGEEHADPRSDLVALRPLCNHRKGGWGRARRGGAVRCGLRRRGAAIAQYEVRDPQHLQHDAQVAIEVQAASDIVGGGLQATDLRGIAKHDGRCDGGVGSRAGHRLQCADRHGGEGRDGKRQLRVVGPAADGIVHGPREGRGVRRQQAERRQVDGGAARRQRLWEERLDVIDDICPSGPQRHRAKFIVLGQRRRASGEPVPQGVDLAGHGAGYPARGRPVMLYFRQLEGGRDFAAGDRVAAMMDNFVYLVGDRDAGQCVVVDPAWDVDGLVGIAETDGMRVVGALLSHWHPDHVGGPMYGHDVEGIARLLARVPDCRVWVHGEDLPVVAELTGVAPSALTAVGHGQVVRVGAVEVECLHTPGHTKGSQCFRCRNALMSGDTVFMEGCGRVDLPGGDVDEMYRTLTERLAALPGDLVLYPGHNYGSRRSAPLADVRRTNPMLATAGYEAFRALRG